MTATAQAFGTASGAMTSAAHQVTATAGAVDSAAVKMTATAGAFDTAAGTMTVAAGKVAATVWGPAFPKYVLLLPGDAVAGLVATLLMCALASTLAIRVALKVDPGAAIG